MSDIVGITSTAGITLRPAPITASWILEGTPTARNAQLFRNQDWSSWTMMWECTHGRFNWFYDIDETVHIVEGEVVITADGQPPRRLGPGDVAFFPAGSHAVWYVERYVRKIAFCRRTIPAPIDLLIKVYRKLRSVIAPQPTSVLLPRT